MKQFSWLVGISAAALERIVAGLAARGRIEPRKAKQILTGMTLGLLSATSSALASGVAQGTITTYYTGVQGGQEFLVVYFSSINNGPPCAGGPGDVAGRFVYTAANANYKSVLATVMAAYFSGASVLAEGLGTCSFWANTEDLSYICPGVGSGGC